MCPVPTSQWVRMLDHQKAKLALGRGVKVYYPTDFLDLK